jgi:hypothetical protein
MKIKTSLKAGVNVCIPDSTNCAPPITKHD